jgi:hypothetical protein
MTRTGSSSTRLPGVFLEIDMPFLLVPNEVEAATATVWIGVINEGTAFDQGTLRLSCNGQDKPIPAMPATYETGSKLNNIRHVYFKVEGLEPATNYLFELFHDGNSVSVCNTRTLPADLPFLGEHPFTVLLSSCFCASEPNSSAIGNTYFNLLIQDRPDIKILCGDQVYLDAPALNFVIPKSDKRLEDTHFANYVDTWTQEGFPFGNKFFLQNGANFFSADDHEFWNNAPDFASFLPDTFSPEGRETWWKFASDFFRIFQTEKSVKKFEVGPVSFFMLDTRVKRDPGRENFITADDRNDLENWINGLAGIGVLVIGQPVFSVKAGPVASVIADKSLPNYKQYEDLAGILSRTRRSIIVLTGDVHFSRLSECRLLNGKSIYEVISSPSRLVSWLAKGDWEKSPDDFPAVAVEDVFGGKIATNDLHQLSEDHFLTLGFVRDGGAVTVIIKAVKIAKTGQPPEPVEIARWNFLL